MVCTHIYSFLALEGKYLEPATSSHPIEAEGYEIRSDFISLVRELNFARGLDENPYKHLQDFEEICATLMISGMNHETLKWKAFSFLLTGWAKQWYKLHVNSCHGSWVILKDEFGFACELKGLKFDPARQDLEEFMTSKENLLELSAIISRNWSTAVAEDITHIRIYPDSKTICCCLQGFSFQMVCYDPRVRLNISLLDEASSIDIQPLIPSTKILQ
jgi:hypothetical protein